MRFRPLLLLLFSCGLLPALAAQTDSIGQWRTYQSFANGTYVTESETSIIYTTGRAIFYLDKEDLSITRLTRTEGLAEASVNLLRYHAPTQTLIIVYENSTIDLLRDGRFSTLRQIDNFNFSGDKRIYDLSFGDNNLVYISAGFGLTALSLNDETFRFTTFTGVRVNGAAAHNGQLYAATEEGLYRIAATGSNPNDFGNWELLGFAAGLPGGYRSTAITQWRGDLYFGVDEDVWRIQNAGAALHFDTEDRDYRLQYISGGPNQLLAGYRCRSSNCADRQLLILNQNPGQARRKTSCLFRTNFALEDDRGRIWFGDDAEDIRYFPSVDEACVQLSYPGPPNDKNYRLLHDGTSLWVAPGVLDENFSPQFDFGGVYRLKNGSWTSLNLNNTAAFLGRDGVNGGGDEVATIVDVHYDASNDRHYFSSFYEGVIALEEETATLIDETNSSLQLSAGAGPGRVRVAGAATDAAGFTYFANSRAAEGGIVSVRSPDGQWAALGQGCSLNLALDVVVDDNNLIWVVHTDNIGGGLTVIDPMGTPLNPADDRCRTITTSNSNLPTSQVRSIAVDLEGQIWVGTTAGIVVFDCLGDVFDPEGCTGSQPIARDEDGDGFLLETEEIRAITVDGGNRKWIATNGGVYLVSPRGEEQLLNFDAGNSPLLDNTVRDIAIDPTTGTVYFGTDLGIISFRGEATRARRTFAEELVIFPNPVTPGYDGPVAIGGLTRDAVVRITDLSGKLVDEGVARGGQYIWSGTDYNGRRVTTGVYLIFASTNNEDSFSLLGGGADPESAIGKVVFIR